jgi:hypothetical protein
MSANRGTYNAQPGPIAKVILEEVILPDRAANIRRPDGKYTPEERDRADRISRNWALVWLQASH